MSSGYLLRKAMRQERRDDELCPRCEHRIGAHRGMPGECIECSGCTITFEDLATWRREGRLSR